MFAFKTLAGGLPVSLGAFEVIFLTNCSDISTSALSPVSNFRSTYIIYKGLTGLIRSTLSGVIIPASLDRVSIFYRPNLCVVGCFFFSPWSVSM